MPYPSIPRSRPEGYPRQPTIMGNQPSKIEATCKKKASEKCTKNISDILPPCDSQEGSGGRGGGRRKPRNHRHRAYLLLQKRAAASAVIITNGKRRKEERGGGRKRFRITVRKGAHRWVVARKEEGEIWSCC